MWFFVYAMLLAAGVDYRHTTLIVCDFCGLCVTCSYCPYGMEGLVFVRRNSEFSVGYRLTVVK